MKGYKVFNPDFTCRDFKFEVGKTYAHKGEIRICSSGFHFCTKANDCFSYYSFDPKNIVCEVEAKGKTEGHDDDSKVVTNKLKIVRKLTWHEVLEVANLGTGNTGHSNSGNRNSGDWNSGNRNSGNSNSGNRNSGDWNSGNRNSGNSNSGNWNSGNSNSGDWNSGNSNSGNRNSGNWNSGDWNSGNSNSGNRNSGNSNSGNRNSGNSNSGDWNSGNWNSGNRNSGDSNSGYRNSGAFCTENDPKLFLFDKPTKMTVREWEDSEAVNIMYYHLEPNMWIWSEDMTEDQKKANPDHETTGGFLKSKTMHDAWADMWGNLSDEKKNVFLNLPNFDKDKWREITGIEV